MKKTLFDKIWDKHVVQQIDQGPDVLFIDRHMIHEVTSPVAFLGLKNRNIKVMSPERTFATADHNTPTINQHLPVKDPLSAKQLAALEKNAKKYGISYWGLGHEKNGIVHVVGPEYGITLPGATIVCGDSHTSTLVHLVPLLLELELLKWKWFYLLNVFFSPSQKKCELILKVNYKRELLQKM